MKWSIYFVVIVLVACFLFFYMLPKIFTREDIFSATLDELHSLEVIEYFPIQKSKILYAENAETLFMEIRSIAPTGGIEKVKHGELSHDIDHAIVVTYDGGKKIDKLYYTENHRYIYRYVSDDFQKAFFAEDKDSKILDLLKTLLEN